MPDLELDLRAPTENDAAAIADALNAHSRSLYGTDDSTAAEVRTWFAVPDIDAAQDMRVAVLPDGSIAAYADLGGGYGEPPGSGSTCACGPRSRRRGLICSPPWSDAHASVAVPERFCARSRQTGMRQPHAR